MALGKEVMQASCPLVLEWDAASLPHLLDVNQQVVVRNVLVCL